MFKPSKAQRAYGSMYLTVPVDTVVSTPTTFVKLEGNFVYGDLLHFTNEGGNRFVFKGTHAHVEIHVSAGISHNVTDSSTVRVCIMKNGNTPLGPAAATQSAVSSLTGVTSNLSTTVQTAVTKDDYLEVWVALDLLNGNASKVTPNSVFVTVKSI